MYAYRPRQQPTLAAAAAARRRAKAGRGAKARLASSFSSLEVVDDDGRFLRLVTAHRSDLALLKRADFGIA
jgi:hypothetical protein